MKTLILALILAAVSTMAAGTSTVTMKNELDYTLSLTVDGEKGCTAPSNDSCTVTVSEGTHRFAAVNDSGEEIQNSDHYVAADENPVWTISYK